MPTFDNRGQNERRGSKAVVVLFCLKIDSHVSSGATRWATGWSIGQDGPAGKAAFCLLSEPEQRWVVLILLRLEMVGHLCVCLAHALVERLVVVDTCLF